MIGASARRREHRHVQPQMDPSWLEAVGDELETPAMQALRSFLASEVAAGRGFFPPGAARLQRATADPARLGARRDSGPGSVSRPWTGHGTLLLGPRRRGTAAFTPQHLHRARDRPRSADSRRQVISRPGPSVASCSSTACSPLRRDLPPHTQARAGRRSPIASLQSSPATRGNRVSALGPIRAAEGRDRRPDPPPRADCRSPLTVLGEQRILRLPPFLARNAFSRKTAAPSTGALTAASQTQGSALPSNNGRATSSPSC